MVAALLLAMLIAGGRKAARTQAHRERELADDGRPYRSHAEASRGR